MGNIYSVIVSRPTRKGGGETLVSRVVDAGKAGPYEVQDWFEEQYKGLSVSVVKADVVNIDAPIGEDPIMALAPTPESPKDGIVETVSYVSDVEVPMVGGIRELFNRAKEARIEYLRAERELNSAAAIHYRDPFVERVEGIGIDYDHERILIGRIILRKALFTAMIRKEKEDKA